MKTNLETKKFKAVNTIELRKTFGGEVIKVEYYENGVRKIKYVEV